MNVLKDNLYTRSWQKLGMTLSCPWAIVMVLARWLTCETGVTAIETPPTIHDFGGFPQVLYDAHYPAPGLLTLVQRLAELLAPIPATPDKEAWGFNHGSWGMLIKMHSDADIPMMQLSIGSGKPAAWHFKMGCKLAALRDEGIMLVASGNVVHNLRIVKRHSDSSSCPWAASSNEYARASLMRQGPVEQHPLANYLDHGGGTLSNPTPEHRLPLLCVLGAWDGQKPIIIPVEGIEMGSLSMLSMQID